MNWRQTRYIIMKIVNIYTLFDILFVCVFVCLLDNSKYNIGLNKLKSS